MTSKICLKRPSDIIFELTRSRSFFIPRQLKELIAETHCRKAEKIPNDCDQLISVTIENKI